MDKYLIFNKGSRELNNSEFNILNSMLNFHFGYPNQMGTLTYADPIIHPAGEMVAIPIMPEAQQFISQDQRDSLVAELPEEWNQ